MDDKKKGINDPELLMPEKKRAAICPHCKQEIEAKSDVCPLCGHYLYKDRPHYDPINKDTARKVRWIIGAVLIGVFAVLVFLGVIELEACSA